MRRVNIDLNDVKERIKNLKGQSVEMSINRGRKKIESVSGVVKDIYPSVFTVITNDQTLLQTFSYFDVLCGKVIFN